MPNEQTDESVLAFSYEGTRPCGLYNSTNRKTLSMSAS